MDYASVAESVDASDLKSVEHYVHGGSSPPARTKTLLVQRLESSAHSRVAESINDQKFYAFL